MAAAQVVGFIEEEAHYFLKRRCRCSFFLMTAYAKSGVNQICFVLQAFFFWFSFQTQIFWELFLFRERWDFVPTLRCCIYSASGGRCLYGLTFWMNLQHSLREQPGTLAQTKKPFWIVQRVVNSSLRPIRVWPQGLSSMKTNRCPVSFSMRKKRCFIHKCQISHKLHSLFSRPILQFYIEENSYPESIRWAPRWSEIQRKWSTQNAGFFKTARHAWSKKFLGVEMVLGIIWFTIFRSL